jgi:hypothetical protein
MRDNEFPSSVDLSNARIKGQLDISRSKFKKKVTMSGIQVGGVFHMLDGVQFTDINLSHAKVDDQLVISGARITGQFTMEGIEVAKELIMTGTEVTSDEYVDLVFANVGAVNLSGSKFRNVDMTGIRIRDELKLVSGNQPVRWEKGSQFVLRNANVGALNDSVDTWPDKLELDGFVYNQTGGVNSDASSEFSSRQISWLLDWLARQSIFSPQSYQQLAALLQKSGHGDKAGDVLYESKKRQRAEVATGTEWLWMTLLWLFVGFGYRMYYTIFWVALFVCLGALVLKVSNQGEKHRMPYGVAYSFDILLPIVKLRDLHYKIDLEGWARYYFYFHKIMGYVLASFLIAGISGITK